MLLSKPSKVLIFKPSVLSMLDRFPKNQTNGDMVEQQFNNRSSPKIKTTGKMTKNFDLQPPIDSNHSLPLQNQC